MGNLNNIVAEISVKMDRWKCPQCGVVVRYHPDRRRNLKRFQFRPVCGGCPRIKLVRIQEKS